jgi:hypothetical protein
VHSEIFDPFESLERVGWHVTEQAVWPELALHAIVLTRAFHDSPKYAHSLVKAVIVVTVFRDP